jgi:hypothetical protein
MLLENFLDSVDLDRLDINVGVRRPGQRHQQHFFEQLVTLILSDVRAAKNIQYVLEICDCHWFLTLSFSYSTAVAASLASAKVYTALAAGIIVTASSLPQTCQRKNNPAMRRAEQVESQYCPDRL